MAAKEKGADSLERPRDSAPRETLMESMESWYAIQVRPRYERLVLELLSDKICERFLPIHESRRRWSDRWKRLERPLFPGYVFGRFRLAEKHLVMTTSGVVRIVGIGQMPAPVPDEEIAALQQLVRQRIPIHAHEFVSAGERICLRSGPFAGLAGIIVRRSGESRLVVSVNLLRRSVAVEVEAEWIAGGRSETPFVSTLGSAQQNGATASL